MKKVKNKKGFTLIELIVVIAILGILAAIAIPRLGSFRSDAAVEAHNANVRTIESAANMYVAQYGSPSTGTYGQAQVEEFLQDWPNIPENVRDITLGSGQSAGDPYTVSVDTNGNISVTPDRVE